MAGEQAIGHAATRIFPSHRRRYTAALTGSASAEIAYTAIVGADGERIGETQMLAIQCSVRTHIFTLDSTGEDTASTDDPYLEAGEVWEGYLDAGDRLVVYPTANGRINIWESSR